MKRTYDSPSIRELGTLEQLTRSFNKVGKATDVYTQLTQGAVVGSTVAPPP